MRRKNLLDNVCSLILDNARTGKFVSLSVEDPGKVEEIDNILYEYLGMSEEEILKNLKYHIDITT